MDRHVAVIAARGNRVPGPGQLRALVHAALLRCDPDTARGREEAALAARDVRFEHTTATGVSALTATLDTLDALDLQATIDDLATTLGRLGDPDGLGVRRSRALGSLANPQRTLDLYGDPRPSPTLDVSDRGGHAADGCPQEASADGSTPPSRRPTRRPTGRPGPGPSSVTRGARGGTGPPPTCTPTSRPPT